MKAESVFLGLNAYEEIAARSIEMPIESFWTKRENNELVIKFHDGAEREHWQIKIDIALRELLTEKETE